MTATPQLPPEIAAACEKWRNAVWTTAQLRRDRDAELHGPSFVSALKVQHAEADEESAKRALDALLASRCEDAARLDWLDDRVKQDGPYRDLILMSDREDGVWISKVRSGEVRGCMAIDNSETPLPDIRAAIDAARAAVGTPR